MQVEQCIDEYHQPQQEGDEGDRGSYPDEQKEVDLNKEIVDSSQKQEEGIDSADTVAQPRHKWGDRLVGTHQSRGLEHVAHLDVEIAELGVVLLVEGGGPVDTEHEIVVHGHFKAAACGEVGGVETALVVEVGGID